MILTCPYCREDFDANEILFYADPVQNRDAFFTFSNDAHDVTATATAQVYQTRSETTDVNAIRGRKRGGSLRSGSVTSIADLNEADEQEEVQIVSETNFPLGVRVEDTVAAAFFSRYGAGSDFRFQRTAFFYGVKPEPKDGETLEPGYGFACDWEDKETCNIPSVLFVPSRDRMQRLTNRVCPKCHCDLPERYFITDDEHKHVGALAGCTSAGKTQFITVALRELIEAQFSSLHLGTIKWTTCSKWFHDLYVKQYKDAGITDATKTAYSLFPLMIRIDPEDNSESHFVTFYDCAGEYANNNDYAANLQSFDVADTLLLMIDCKQLFGADVQFKDGELPCSIPYRNAVTPLKEFSLCRNLKRAIVVITKCDAIIGQEGYIHDNTSQYVNDGMLVYTHDLSCHNGRVDRTTLEQVQGELMGMLTSHGDEGVLPNIAADLCLDLSQVSLLAVSTYCWTSGGLTSKPNQISGHHRLTEPLLKAMADWNIVPSEYKELPASSPNVEEEPAPEKAPRCFLFWKKKK